MNTARFNGFDKGIFSYLSELENNNNKQWFDDNRDRYEQVYLAPAMTFVGAMEACVAALDPPHKGVAKINGSIRRINRDVRFSKDKSPYHARLHLIFWSGDHPSRSPAIHLLLTPRGFGYGTGQWALGPEQLECYRQAISTTKSRRTFLDAVAKAGEVGCQLGPPALKTVPRGYDKDAEWSELLKHKAIVARTSVDIAVPEQLLQASAISFCTDLFGRLAPLNRWITKHIGG